MQNAAKNHSIEIEMLNGNKSQAGNIGENDNEKDEKNINIFTADLYFHAIIIMHIRSRE